MLNLPASRRRLRASPSGMPRLLPKLVQAIRSTQKGHRLQCPTRRPPSRRTRRSVPATLPYPNFSPHGRKQSILLDDVNPILHSDAFKQPKLDAPIIPSAAGRGKHSHDSRVREMTDRECEWWSNPYREMTLALYCNHEWYSYQSSQNVIFPSSSVHSYGEAITCRSEQMVFSVSALF